MRGVVSDFMRRGLTWALGIGNQGSNMQWGSMRFMGPIGGATHWECNGVISVLCSVLDRLVRNQLDLPGHIHLHDG